MTIVKQTAVLDSAHIGDIRGALGTIRHGDVGPRNGLWHRIKTLLAIIGPGIIVMVGDNDAGAFGTYSQAGQNYGTSLLWVLALLIPVLYVNQEMVLRLGAVTGVGHARLILERFGKFWGAFSVIDLFILNALTIVTEFIGISLGLGFLGVSKFAGIAIAAVLIIIAAGTGDFRRFERISLILVVGSLLLVPIFIMVHPAMPQVVHDFVIPQMPKEAKLSDIMLLIIAIIGTTVAPWQLFFQQSYVIDKRITPRFIKYGRIDLWLGIIIVIVGAAAMIAFTAEIFAGRPEFGNFTDAGGIATGLATYHSKLMGTLFAVALIDACIIGAAAVSLSTAYAIGDVLSLKHSLHRKPSEAKGFYAVYVALIVVAVALVVMPGVPLGLLTNAVQTLAGILLPSASVFLLLLCNDKEVLGPWVNSKSTNLFTAIVCGILVLLSLILTASMVFPDISGDSIMLILAGGGITGLLIAIGMWALRIYKAAERREFEAEPSVTYAAKDAINWRMPPLNELKPPQLSFTTRVWLGILRAYLVIATVMVAYKVIQLAFGHAQIYKY
ncbi:NRAMP family divalent metal transporter [Sideroxydans sp. CL21]|uniref:NRAMP family divalent metal transporter n=1 Tax=Sideroxydans sp. CL21 TaxID=2600596 RepID=UPI0024BCDE33|nr:NRAMP family divalent metal transporter [Sideroxydans sp. CL21]